MNERPRNLINDLEALRYLDALEAGDLEGIAARWEQASREADRESMLAELDEALFDEQVAAHREVDRQRIAVQSSAQGIVFGRLFQPRHRLVPWQWAAAIGTAAAAGLVGLFVWFAHENRKTDPIVVSNEPAQPIAPVTYQANSTHLAVEMQSRRALDLDDIPPFSWPVQGEDSALGIRLNSASFDRSEKLDLSF
jgi:hypothetical protein